MKEFRCPNCKKLLFKGEFVGKVEIICSNGKCSYHNKPILFDVMSHVWDLLGERVAEVQEYSTAS